MPAKTPIYLKTPTSKRGKRFKLRDVLSGDMISPPLGDLRHSAHVGPEGESDMFGDVGFLQGNLGMLPGLPHPPHPSSKSMDQDLDMFDEDSKNEYSHYNSNHTSLLKSTISMPAFITHEQPPPKPPRLHLEENTTSELEQQNHHYQQQCFTSICHKEVEHYRESCHEFTVSASIPMLNHIVPSAGSFSEVSSDDSMSDSCGPLDPKRGLSLDSDAGLSNEDLQSEYSESPALSPTMPHSESLGGLDLDLGPSILEDVLQIMDRYKTEGQV